MLNNSLETESYEKEEYEISLYGFTLDFFKEESKLKL